MSVLNHASILSGTLNVRVKVWNKEQEVQQCTILDP